MNRFLSPSPLMQQEGLALIRLIVGFFLIYHGWEVFSSAKMETNTCNGICSRSRTENCWFTWAKVQNLLRRYYYVFGLFTRLGCLIIIGSLGYIAFVVGQWKSMDGMINTLSYSYCLHWYSFLPDRGRMSLDRLIFNRNKYLNYARYNRCAIEHSVELMRIVLMRSSSAAASAVVGLPKSLCEKGLKTLVLERGRNVEHIKDYPTMNMAPWEFRHRGTMTKDFRDENPLITKAAGYGEDTAHFFVKDKDHPYIQEKPFDWIRGYQVGGKSLTWGRACARWSEADFTFATTIWVCDRLAGPL